MSLNWESVCCLYQDAGPGRSHLQTATVKDVTAELARVCTQLRYRGYGSENVRCMVGLGAADFPKLWAKFNNTAASFNAS